MMAWRARTIVALLLLLCLSGVDAWRGYGTVAFARPDLFASPQKGLNVSRILMRGGADTALDSEDEYDSEEEETDSDEEIEAEKKVADASLASATVKSTLKQNDKKLDKSLASSAVKATTKTQAKKTASTKQAVSETLAKSKVVSKKKKKGILKALRIPYIVRASLNPLTLMAMTKAYFASLFNLNYLKEDTSQNLRSALEEKAKKGGGGNPTRKRKMKPGQAKTLSDLPQLST